VLHTDWSQLGLGCVLGQVDDKGQVYMVACQSRSLNEHEKRYTPWKGELLAAVWGMRVMRAYLHGAKHPFLLYVDHRPLIGMLTNSEPNSQTVRWLMVAQEMDFIIKHRPGTTHINADVLSRFPVASKADTVGARMDSGTNHAPTLPPVMLPDGTTITGAAVAANLSPTWQEEYNKHATVNAACVASDNTTTDISAAVAAAWRYSTEVLPDNSSESWLDTFAPCSEQLVCMHASAYPSAPTVDVQSAQQYQQELLAQQASLWVDAAAGQQQPDTTCLQLNTGGALNTTCCSDTFFPWARRHGITLFEPFGGLGAGLEMVLRHGVSVNKYIYCDTSPTAQSRHTAPPACAI
jgi:hypothetical protein